ncbi:hypothetical protein PMIN03_002707 [Paraphaeosphaeria minitans]
MSIAIGCLLRLLKRATSPVIAPQACERPQRCETLDSPFLQEFSFLERIIYHGRFTAPTLTTNDSAKKPSDALRIRLKHAAAPTPLNASRLFEPVGPGAHSQ